MKTIGILGGMSWESTVVYYTKINQYVKETIGPEHSAKILLYSFDYHELEVLLEENDWTNIESRLINEAKALETMGADCLMLGANTMHIAAHKVEQALKIPLIHIVKATRDAIKNKGMKKVLLLGTMYTMRSDLYPNLFKEEGIEVITPSKRDQASLHRIIYQELIKGDFLDSSKQKVLGMIDQERVDGVILGCTEIPLLIKQSDCQVPLFDTLELHVKAAVDFAINIER